MTAGVTDPTAAAAARAADAARAAYAAQWRWMHLAFECARPRAWRPEWHTSTVVALARGIFEDRAFDRMPILADALLDAGCDDGELVTRLQGGGVFSRADVALWTPLGLGDALGREGE